MATTSLRRATIWLAAMANSSNAVSTRPMALRPPHLLPRDARQNTHAADHLRTCQAPKSSQIGAGTVSNDYWPVAIPD